MSEPDRLPCPRCGLTDRHEWTDQECVLPAHSWTGRRHPPNATIGRLCGWCVDRHRDWLGEVVDLYATLPEVLLAGSVPEVLATHQMPRKQPASPSPIRLAAWAMLYDTARLGVATVDRDGVWTPAYLGGNLPDIPGVLTAWAAYVYDVLGWGRAPDTVSGAAAALRSQAEVMAGLPDVDSYDAELRWVRRHLRDAHGLADHLPPVGPCLSVGCDGTVWPVQGDRPRCRRCGRSYDVHALVRLHAWQRRTDAQD